MAKQLLGLDDDGELTLQLSDGRTERAIRKEAYCVVLLDCSGSMCGDKIEDAKLGVLDFTDRAFPGGYQVGLVSFASNARLISSLTADANEIRQSLSALYAGGGTDLKPGLEIALELLLPQIGARVIVVATDGFTANRTGALESAKRASEAGIEIITIGTEDADSDFLRELATTEAKALQVRSEEIGDGIRRAAALLPPPS